MTRVFPAEEEGPSRESRRSTNSFRMDYDIHEPKDAMTGFPFRKRLQSLPLAGGEMDLEDGIQSMSFQTPVNPNANQEGGKKTGGIRALLRKASISIKNRQRRHSHAVEERPQTAWNRLRTATSFHNRHSKFLVSSPEFETQFDSYEAVLSPIPGSGNAPPLIPHGHGGAAARATAAAQNEYFARNRQLFLQEDQFGDRESGIGIAVTVSETVEYSTHSISNDISRVDFISELPTELAIQILESLDHTTLRNTVQVSRRWAEMSSSQHVWKKVFVREQSRTFATSGPVAPGTGLGLPNQKLSSDWKELFRIREELRQNWMAGAAEAVYLNGHLDSIYCVQYDENKIITGSRDKTIRVWDMDTYTCTLVIGPPEVIGDLTIMTGEDGKPQHYATMPDMARLAESTPKSVSFPIHHNQSILCLQYDEDILVTGSSDGSCIVYDINNGYRPIRRLQHHTAAVLDLAFDKRYIVTCSKDVSICVWDRETGAMLKQLR